MKAMRMKYRSQGGRMRDGMRSRPGFTSRNVGQNHLTFAETYASFGYSVCEYDDIIGEPDRQLRGCLLIVCDESAEMLGRVVGPLKPEQKRAGYFHEDCLRPSTSHLQGLGVELASLDQCGVVFHRLSRLRNYPATKVATLPHAAYRSQ